MEVLIQGTVSALGFLENGIYYQEPDCYETIRDLIRFLRDDNSEMLARRICGERNIIGNDLIPILKSENLKSKTFDIALRLLVNLTQPAIVSLQGKQPEDSEEWQKYWVLEENLRKAKSSFADMTFFAVLKQRLEMYFLETAWEDRLEEDRLVMERIIVLLRYVFTISHAEGDERGIVTETTCHDRITNAFLDSGIQKVLVHIALQSKERDFHLSILSIFSLIIEKHNPSDIVIAGCNRTTAEKEKAEEELRKIVENEQARLTEQRRRILANRHSTFCGSYVVKGLRSVNKENDLLVHKPVKNLSEITFLNERKTKKVVAKNRRPFEGKIKTHTSSLDLRIKLKAFVEELLSSCFNRLMKSTKELAFDSRLSFGQRDSDLHFFLLMRFFLEYTRLSGRSSSEVSICLSVEAFHHVQVQITNYMESAVTMKKEAKQFGIRVQYSLSAYKELILILQHVIDSGSSEEKDIAQRTLYHILVVEEYREMGLTMIRKFSPGFLSKTYLSELVLSTHYYFRLLEKAVKTGRLNTVKKRSKIRRRTARRKKESEPPASLLAVVDSLSPENLNNKWSSIANELKDIIVGNLEPSPNQIPVNSLLDVQEEQHQKFAMLKVQRAMREGRAQDAMGLYRASREMWPTDGIFGDPDSSVDEQLAEIREIFFTDLKDVANELLNVELATQKKFSSDSMLEEEIDDRYYSDEEENEEDRFETKEVNFDFPEYVAKYARTDVLRWYVFLLNDFATNSFELNKALIKLLHRVAFDLNMPSRLFQLSLFRIFAQVKTHFKGMLNEDIKKNALFELFNFGHHLLKKFFSCYEILQDKLAPEILFWKGPRECYEIQNGYGTYDASKNVKEVSAWSWDEELENELRSLYSEYRDMEERPEGMDVLDFIEPNLSRPRTRKQIFKKLKEFALDPLGAKANKGSVIDRNFPIKQMKELIEEYNSVQGREDDMVEFLRARLKGNQGQEFSRQKIIKQINHQGIVYEKSASKKSKWSEFLQTELKLLKQQYDEMDEDDHALIDVVDYVMRRLSEKKPRRQVERELMALGVDIKPKDKSRLTKERRVNQSTGTSEDDGNQNLGRTSDEGLELDSVTAEDRTMEGGTISSTVDGTDNDHPITSPVKSTYKQNRIVANSDDADENFEMDNTMKESVPYVLPAYLEGTNFESTSTDALGSAVVSSSPIKSTGKRKRVLSTSDEDDNFEKENLTSYQSPLLLKDTNLGSTSTDMLGNDGISSSPLNSKGKRKRVLSISDEDDNFEMENTKEVSSPSRSPVPLNKTKHRVIVSDSEED